MKFALLLLITLTPVKAAGLESVDVFTSGTEGYGSIRIPVLLVTKDFPPPATRSGPRPGRARGTLYVREDDGLTWTLHRVIYPGLFACSVLTRLPDGAAGCLFEADNYARIGFARFRLE